MGLFSKRDAGPIDYPVVPRTVHVPARRDAVVAHLTAYSGLWSPKRAEQHEVLIGEVGGWTAIQLPDAVHPWQLHNLAFWMLDCPGLDELGALVAESAAGPDHPRYLLVRDPEVDDALCGWDERGDGWTVYVPSNDIVRGEDVPVPQVFSVPSGHHDWHRVPVLLEDPGRGMNERNESNVKNRRSLRESTDVSF
jgi:hypothetical protein